jgi:hypothetical protein
VRRRDVLIAGGLAAPMMLSAGRGSAAAAAAGKARPDIAVFDGRHEASRRWARQLEQTGVTVIDARRDVARLWYGPLKRVRGRGGRPVIAGLTTWADFQVLSGCAAEARLAVSHELTQGSGPAERRRGTLVSWTIT